MNKIFNTFSSKFIQEIHLLQKGFTNSSCGPFLITSERLEKFKETSNGRYALKNKLAKVSFRHNLAYGRTKDLIKRTVADNVPGDKAFEVAHDGY